MRRTLVTGAAGFIGSHLVRRLLAEGDEVHALLRDTTRLDRLHALAGDITIHRANLDDRAALDRCLTDARPERVFHLAVDPRSMMTPDIASVKSSLVNLGNLFALIEALSAMALPPQVMVRAGTIAAYGRAPLPFREDCREQPVNPYGASMVAGSHFLSLLAPVLPFPVATARLALVYGPGQAESFFIPAAIRKCLDGERLTVRNPADRRDLIHVNDAVDGLLALAQSPPPGASIVNICTGLAPRMDEVARLILAATDGDPALVDYSPQSALSPVSELISDPTLARELFDWEAAIPLAEGVALTVAETLRTEAQQPRKAG